MNSVELNTSKVAADVVAVIVTYNPSVDDLVKSANALIEQGCRVVIIDNGSVNSAKVQAQLSGVQLLFNPSNLGLGAAHNQGWNYAKETNAQYLLVMDQDSLPKSGMVDALVTAIQDKSRLTKVSAVGACYAKLANGMLSFFVRFGALKFKRRYVVNDTVEADFLISSGSLFSLESLEKIGGMDESLFIDHVDTEWFLRARSLGFKAFGVGAARMQHGLGEKTHSFNIAGRQRNVPQHKPFRYYYIFRNSVLLYKRGYTSWLWKWNDVQRLLIIVLMFGVWKAPRRSNLKMMIKGGWHGAIGKSGKAE